MNPLTNYTTLCDKAEKHKARVELWAGQGNKQLQTLRVVTGKRAHCTPIVDHDIDEAADRMPKKHIF